MCGARSTLLHSESNQNQTEKGKQENGYGLTITSSRRGLRFLYIYAQWQFRSDFHPKYSLTQGAMGYFSPSLSCFGFGFLFSLFLLRSPAAASARFLHLPSKPDPNDAVGTARWLVGQNFWGVLRFFSLLSLMLLLSPPFGLVFRSNCNFLVLIVVSNLLNFILFSF